MVPGDEVDAQRSGDSGERFDQLIYINGLPIVEIAPYENNVWM